MNRDRKAEPVFFPLNFYFILLNSDIFLSFEKSFCSLRSIRTVEFLSIQIQSMAHRFEIVLCLNLILQWKLASAKCISNGTSANNFQAVAFNSEPPINNDENEKIEFNLIEAIVKEVNPVTTIQYPIVNFSSDILIEGGPNLFDAKNIDNLIKLLANSNVQDNLIWCVKNSSFYPKYMGFFFIATPECWILIIFGIGYVCGFILYIFIQFDTKYVQRNVRDCHYTTWLILLPTILYT